MSTRSSLSSARWVPQECLTRAGAPSPDRCQPSRSSGASEAIFASAQGRLQFTRERAVPALCRAYTAWTLRHYFGKAKLEPMVECPTGRRTRQYRWAEIGTNWNQNPEHSRKRGGQGRNRTADASLFRAALYRLSYLAGDKTNFNRPLTPVAVRRASRRFRAPRSRAGCCRAHPW
jgi:hypothetical protein